MILRSLVKFLCVSWAVVLIGCEVETVEQPPISYPPANHVVINEVYTLPATHPNAHSWVEIFNPTSQTVNFRKWSLTYTTQRYRQLGLIFYERVIDTNRVPPWQIVVRDFRFTTEPDAAPAVYDVPLVRTVDSLELNFYLIPRGSPDTLLTLKFPDSTLAVNVGPNQFMTLVSDLSRMRVYSNLGPGDGPEPVSTPLLPMQNPLYKVAIFERDSANPRQSIPDTLYGYLYDFFLNQTDQVVLKDQDRRAIDVVRYGGYVHTGGADPYPGNRSIGAVPQFESIARYAGAYSTGNTANDFYITRAGLRPIPHWLSQLWKK
jgi:hypothetical protein